MNPDEELTRAVDTLGERLRDELDRQLRAFTDDVSAAARAAVQAATPPVPEAPPPSETASLSSAATTANTPNEWLLDAVRAIDGARSLGAILDALAAGASQETSRAGVLLVENRRLRGRRFAGFPESFDPAIDVPLEDAGIVAVAVEQKRVASTAADGTAPAFAGLGPYADGTQAMAFPLSLDGRIVGVLYVDQPDPEPGLATLDPAMLEVLSRHATRALEAVTAFRAAHGLVRADTGSMTVAEGTTAGADEDEAARRYARLVISEIKRYHEEAVTEGRRAGDLATRLGGEIARARAQYEQRVPAHLRGASEHFQAELVRTLGGGDERLFAKATVS